MANNSQYVIYRLTFPNGQYYIGKAKNFNRRMQQHRHGLFDGVNLKESTVLANRGFTPKVLFIAPSHFTNEMKQIWMDNMERIIIHCEVKKVYDKITGENSQYKDYQPYKNIINQILVNTQLY